MNDVAEVRAALQETMSFLGAIAGGIEEAIGESANSITYLAGKRLGMSFSAGVEKTDDLEKALESVRSILNDNSCLWHFEAFKTHDRPEMIQADETGQDDIYLVFRDCMIRQSLFRYGHHQKGSLCTMMFGFFSGAIRNIMGHDSTLEILHAGENACYKRLVIHKGSGKREGGESL